MVKKEVKYLNKDFTEFRDNLINFAKVYFPETYNDFNESDPGTMFIEMASYVGDTLSYYLDRQLKESLLSYAEEKSNLYSIAKSLGYTPKVSFASTTDLTIYQLLPSISSGSVKVPDWNYALTIEPGLQVTSTDNISFVCYDKIDFSFSSSKDVTDIQVYSKDTSNEPEYFLLQKKAKVISAEIKTIQFNFTDPKKFAKELINDSNILGILDVVDSDGNTWYEVPYLAQDTIFDKVDNAAYNDPDFYIYNNTVPYLLKLKKVPKRFITRVTADDKLELQFGSGISSNYDEQIIPNPDNIGIGLPIGRDTLDISYDPSNFLYTKTYGEVPANVTLTVRYLSGGGIKSNVPSNTITNIISSNIHSKGNVTGQLYDIVRNSLACNNYNAATGGRAGETIEEIRQNTLANFSSQNRTVSFEDYAIRCLAMPGIYGSITKVYIAQDEQLNLYDLKSKIKNPLALNFYCLGYDSNKRLTVLNSAVKQNLKTYLSQYKMLTDAINIKDAYIVNFRLNFEVIALPGFNSNEVLLNCIQELKKYFDIDNWQINQPIVKSDIISKLLKVTGVQTVTGLRFTNVYSEALGYSKNYYDLTKAERSNVIYPSLDPCIFEIKYPDADIIGRVTSI